MNDASPAPEGAPELNDAPQLEGNEQTSSEEGEFVQPELTDEDYALNFLGSDKFQLERETPEQVRAALKNLEKSLNKGWTEKNMKLAEERRAVQAEREESQREVESKRTRLKELVAVESLQTRVAEYDKVDWARWAQADPQAAQAAFMQADSDRRALAQAKADMDAKEGAERQSQQQAAEAWLRQANERLETAIKGWSPDKGKAIAKFAYDTFLNTGTPAMDRNALQAMAWHPGLTQMAEEARLYRENLQRAKAPPKAVEPPATPVTKVAGMAATTAKNPEKMSDKEWMAWREGQVARKRNKPATGMNRR